MRIRSRLAVAVALAGVLGTFPRVAAQPAPADTFTILFSNDDGFDAPGLQALVKAFAGYGDLFVSAPATNQTAKGHAITFAEVVVAQERPAQGVTRAVAVDGTPATAVRVGLERYMARRPDVVISGINRGENLGMSVYLSGTLGAAREAVFSGIPAIAVSMQGNRPEDYAASAAYVRRLLDDVRARQLLRPGFFLNVNTPAGTPKGVAVTRLSLRASRLSYECTAPLRERAACFPGFDQVRSDDTGTDVAALFDGYISLTPLTLDVTDLKAFESLRALEQTAPPSPR